ncbi:hypothetical protein [Sphaerothrix gracilis]|uniref:hypothetical protein n=1 Tax=Sphaerothrix gracilis TaxID=3151835 RepID=UPI0031FCA477
MQKHIIFTLGRSGSNYLANLLNAHPQVTNYGEVLGGWTIPYKLYKRFTFGRIPVDKYLDFIYTSQILFYAAHTYSALAHIKKGEPVNFKNWQQVKTIGIKDFSLNFKRREATSYLKEREDILVINLYRENQFKRFLSLERMKASGLITLQKTTGKADSQPLYLDPSKTIRELEIFDEELKQHQAFVNELQPYRVLNISYEALFHSPESQNYYKEKICDFLDIAPFEISSGHRKISPNKLDQAIENYEEILQTVGKTQFAKYL